MSRTCAMLLDVWTWLLVRVFRVQDNASIHCSALGGLRGNCLLASVLGVAMISMAPSALADIDSVSKTFTPASIIAGGTSTLTITISNNPPGNPNSISFTDNYPAGLTNAAAPALVDSCGGTPTAAANGSSLSLTGGSLKGNSTCTVSVTVTACIAGSYVNPSFAVNSTQGGGNSAPTTLTVVTGTTSAATSTVVATPTSVAANGTTSSTITVTLRDSCGNPVIGNTVALAAGSGSSTISPASGPSNASGVVTFTVIDLVVEGPITYTATDTTDGVGIAQTASVTFVPMPAPTAIKSFSPATIVINGTSTMTVTLNNSNPAPITGLGFTDAYPSGLVNTATPALSSTCGGIATGVAGGNSLELSGGTIPASGSCTININVTSNTAGSYSNSTGIIFSSNANNGTPSIAALTVNPPVSSFNVVEPGADQVSGKIVTKIAGSGFSLDIVALLASNAISTGFTGTVSVEVVDGTSGGACATLPVIATFADQTFIAGDAGRHALTGSETVLTVHRNARIRITYSGPPSITSCSGDNFAIRPASLSLVNATDTDSTNAGIARALNTISAANGNVHRAGRNFTIRATARNASNVVTAGYDGSPTVKTIACTLPTPTCINGTLTPGTWNPASGVVTTSTATYSEAGSFMLTLEDQAFASVDAGAGDSTLVQRTIPQDAPVAVGRFVPDHFDVAASNVPQLQTFNATDGSCTAGAPVPVRTFTYIGQRFGYVTTPVSLAPQATITARNAFGATTRNYSLDLWKLIPASVTQTYSTVQARDADSIIAPTVTATFGNVGTGTVSSNPADTLAFTRDPSTPQSPFSANITLTVTVTDSSEDGTAGNGIIGTSTSAVFSNMAFDSGNVFRYGRLKLSNAHGSELLRLPVPSEAQYWNGSMFITNTADHCTTVALANIGLAPNTCSSVIADTVFLSGRGNLQLAASNTKCSAILTIDLLPQGKFYLQGRWSGSDYDQNPTSKVTFGLFKAGPIIYMRERY